MRAGGIAALVLLSLASPGVNQRPTLRPPTDLYTASVHTFRVVRSGAALDDPATGLHHPASHMEDAVLAGGNGRRDLTGGWYNAADYGKWTMMAAITVSYMLDLYEVQARAAQAQGDHPPDPVLLEEARWGLDWMLKMQDADGGVRQKVDGATQASLSAAWGKPPESDPNVRIAAPASTGSTADFTAVMYQAAEFFASRDQTQSGRFRAAADRGWTWIERHPDVSAHDLFYADHDPAGELLWAESEHALTYDLESAELAMRIRKRLEPEVSSRDPSLLGLYRLASARRSPPLLREAAQHVILQQANALAKGAAGRAFHVVLGDRDYSWGSAERVLQCAALLLMADSLQPSELLHRAAADQLSWMLGKNAANHSFIVGFGTNPVLHPWHWAYRDYGISLSGWAVLGPNGFPEGVDPALRALQQQGTPPDRCYVDACNRGGSWASNEGQISEEAALVFVTGVLRLSPNR